ncbi:gamma-glutamyltransferase [Chondromyces crocatus]|nr:gamma-glutamyltransferase [Chondromyces crocatus]
MSNSRLRRLLVSLSFVGAVACEAGSPAPPPAGAPAHSVTQVPAESLTASASSPLEAPAVLPVSVAAPSPSEPPPELTGGGKRAVRGDAGLVTSVEPHATRAGLEVLRKGGNAVDAAVAVAFALAVTHPSAGNLGGGGFMVIRRASGESHTIDFRETAPAAATTGGILAMVKKGAYGYPATAVPGTVAGLELAHQRFGSRPWSELVAPATALAREGHRLGARQALVLGWAWSRLQQDRAARAIWGRQGKPVQKGDLVKQPDLSRTLEAIASEGARAFYEGPIAKKIAVAMAAHRGLVTEEDLRSYRAKLRAPLRFTYRGFTVDTMGPPSMGGIAFAQIMRVLERAKAHEAPAGSGLSHHLFAEAARRAYSDRRRASADPDFSPGAQPLLATLLDDGYLEARRPLLDRERATPSVDIAVPPEPEPLESQQTTHFSVVDAQGNAVACTVTLSAGFGAKVVVPGTGVIFSNALAAFSPTGTNTVAPGKRMQSSMSPAIVSRSGHLALVLGSPGGDTIPNTLAQVFRNLVDHGMTVDEAVESPRVHHQWLPDRLRIERNNPPSRSALEDLRRRGHALHLDAMPIGHANSILVDASGTAWGHADSREGGIAEGHAPAQAAPKR